MLKEVGALIGQCNGEKYKGQDHPTSFLIKANDKIDEKRIKWNPCIFIADPIHQEIEGFAMDSIEELHQAPVPFDKVVHFIRDR